MPRHRHSLLAFCLCLALSAELCAAQQEGSSEPPETGSQVEAAKPTPEDVQRLAKERADEKTAQQLLERAITKQLGTTRDHVLRSFITEISLIDQRQGNLEARLAIAFASGTVPAQDGIKLRTRLGDEVETTRFGVQYWISKNSSITPQPMTEAVYQKDKADLRRYSKMCRTLMHALSLAGLAHSIERPSAKADLEVDWFDGSRRKMAFVIEGWSRDIGGLLAETKEGESSDAKSGGFNPLKKKTNEEASAKDLAEVRLYFNGALELERIDVRRDTPEHDAPWQAYRFLGFERKDVGGRRYVWAPTEFRVYESLPLPGLHLEHAVQIRMTTLKFNPELTKSFFEKRWVNPGS